MTLRGQAIALFLRARRVGWALVLTVVLGVGLLDRPTQFELPLFGTFTTTVFIWPLLATGATALVLEASTVEWDRRSSRPMVVLDGVTVLATIAVSALGPVLLRPPGWMPALAIFLTLQALTVVAATVLGDWAWMLTVGLGSLTVVNSEFVTRTIVTVTGEHWVAFTAASALVLVLARGGVPVAGAWGRLRRRT